jgi:hypothetical protein
VAGFYNLFDENKTYENIGDYIGHFVAPGWGPDEVWVNSHLLDQLVIDLVGIYPWDHPCVDCNIEKIKP